MILKSRKVRLTKPARYDLHRHRQTLESMGLDEEHVDARMLALTNKIFDIARKGIIGSKRSYAPDHIRAFPWQRYCFYFTVDNGTLVVVRILLQREEITDITLAMRDDDITD